MAMYSIPQQAVTKGYWKIENLRAQPMASSSRLVKNPASPDMSLPLQGAVVPGVEESDHQDAQEDAPSPIKAQRRRARENHGPGIEEDELDVEQDEENRGQVELDRIGGRSGTEKGTCPHSNGSDFTAEGFFGPSMEASATNPPATAPARTTKITIPRYSAMSDLSVSIVHDGRDWVVDLTAFGRRERALVIYRDVDVAEGAFGSGIRFAPPGRRWRFVR